MRTKIIATYWAVGAAVLQRVEHISNLGPFKSLKRDAADACPEFGKLTLVFARNGRGKSTIAHLLRCLELGDSSLAQARHRLGSPDPAAARFLVEGKDVALGTTEWAARPLRIHVFDEQFVHQNVLDGLDNLPEHGRRILPLVIGAKGVELVRKSNELATEIAELNERRTQLDTEIRQYSQGVDPTTFSGATPNPDIDAEIEGARAALHAQEAAARLATQEPFDPVALRNPVLSVVEYLLAATAKGVSEKAREAVAGRLARLGASGEEWLREGVRYGAQEDCPFCARPTHGLDLMSHYDAFFGSAYEEHVASIQRARDDVRTMLGPDAQKAIHAALTKEEARRAFWSEFVPAAKAEHLDPEGLDARWTESRRVIEAALEEKARRPLDALSLSESDRATVDGMIAFCNSTAAALVSLHAANSTIAALKAKTAAGSVSTTKSRLVSAENRKARHTSPLAETCDEYVSILADLVKKRAEKATAKEEIHSHNGSVFAAYQAEINAQLERFQVEPRVVEFRGEIDTAGKGSSDFKIGVEGASVAAGPFTERAPCVGSVLSSGDRTALALAFFLAQFATDPGLRDACVVFDDPVSSLDRHRQDMTRDAILLLATKAKQVIVLSHYADFLADLWSKAHKVQAATTLVLERVPKKGHRLLLWDAAAERLGTFHRLRELLRAFVAEESDDADGAAIAVCAFLEAYVRVVDPGRLPLDQDRWLGTYLKILERDLAANPRLIGPKRLEELRQLVRFGGPHRHDVDSFGIPALRDPDGIRGFAKLALAWVDPDRRDE